MALLFFTWLAGFGYLQNMQKILTIYWPKGWQSKRTKSKKVTFTTISPWWLRSVPIFWIFRSFLRTLLDFIDGLSMNPCRVSVILPYWKEFVLKFSTCRLLSYGLSSTMFGVKDAFFACLVGSEVGWVSKWGWNVHFWMFKSGFNLSISTLSAWNTTSCSSYKGSFFSSSSSSCASTTNPSIFSS